jgi:hypothetical protein
VIDTVADTSELANSVHGSRPESSQMGKFVMPLWRMTSKTK